nr:MAG TPA: hypothetical protein [Caudoviricetes sp.]
MASIITNTYFQDKRQAAEEESLAHSQNTNINNDPTEEPKAAIVIDRRAGPEREIITHPDIYPEHYKSTVVDSRYENLANLIVHVEGSNWKVNYYKQIVTDHGVTDGHHMFRDAIYQEYEKIVGMILKVDTALNWQQNNELKSGITTGSAHLYPPFIPNVGDMFVADSGDGMPSIFQVTVSEKLSMFKQSVYRIEYTLIDYAKGIRVEDLERKVVDTKYFRMDFLEHGQNPVLIKSDMKLAQTISHYLPIISENYLKKYYSNRFRCMILPRNDLFIYDHFLTKCISRWFSADDYYKIQEMKILSVENIKALQIESVFDVLEDIDAYALDQVFTKVGMIDSNAFAVSGRLPQTARIGLHYLIYPIDHPFSVDTHDRIQIKFRLAPTSILNYDYGSFNGTYKERPLLPEIDLNSSYIFSRDFYNRDHALLSQLELQVVRYMEDNNIIKEVIFELISTWSKWNTLQQFYLTPVLIMLMRATLRQI